MGNKKKILDKKDIEWILDENSQKFFRQINPLLYLLNDKLITDKQTQYDYPVIIITGAPRCGSTITSQIFASVMDIAYINNFIARFWMAPVIGALLFKNTNLKISPSYTSFRGSTTKLSDPNEFNYFWKRFFPDGETHYSNSINKHLKTELQRDIAGIINTFQKPLMFKHIFGSQRLHALIDAIPHVRFLVVKRNPVYHAQSILMIRKGISDDISKWWSLKPKEIKRIISKDPCEQVVAQIFYTYREIEKIAKLYPDKFIFTEYEHYMDNIVEESKRLSEKLHIEFKQKYSVPLEKIIISNKQKVENSMFNKICYYTEKYFGETIIMEGKR